MKYIFILFCFLVLPGSYINAQIVTVKDKQTGALLQEVAFMTYKPNNFVITNKNGQADLSSFTNSDHIEIMMMGYQKVICSFDSLRSINYLIQLKSLAFSSDEVVVSSSRFAQNAKDIPFRITTISPREAELNNPQTAADLLGSSGDVFIQKSQMGGGSPMIRGFSTNRLLYSIDGVRMNTAIFRSGNLQNVISLDPLAIKHSEILFGPGSVIYGSDAIGGVMSFQTLSPNLSLTDSVELSGTALARFSSANNENTVHFDINSGWKKWASVTSFSYSQYEDLKMGAHGPDDYLRPFYVKRIDDSDVIVENEDPMIQTPTGYSQMNVMQKIRFQPNKNWNLEYGFHYSETSDYARYDRHIRYKEGNPRYGEWKYGPQKWLMNLITITKIGEGKLYDDLSIKLAHQFFEESRISRNFNDIIRETKTENVDAFSLNVDFNKIIGARHQLFYGLEGVVNNVRSFAFNTNITSGVNHEGAARYPDAIWQSHALYITNQFKLNKKILFQGGMRYNLYDINAQFDTTFYPIPFTNASINNGALTGNLGLVYRPTNKLSWYMNIATGFRSPNVDDMGKIFDSAPGLVVVPNAELNAEYAYNTDISISRIFGSRLKLDATGYYTYLNNAMVRRDFTLNGQDSIVFAGEPSKVQAIQNAVFSSVYGVQIALNMKLGSGFSLLSKVNYQNGTEETDEGLISPARHAAPLFGSIWLTYKYGNLNMSLKGIFSDGRTYEELALEERDKAYLYASDKNGNPYSPAWYILDFKVMYQITQGVRISAGIENLIDQRYRSYSSGITGAGRNMIISVKSDF